MQNGGVIMPIALSSLENETVMPNRENVGKVGTGLVKVCTFGKSPVRVCKKVSRRRTKTNFQF